MDKNAYLIASQRQPNTAWKGGIGNMIGQSTDDLLHDNDANVSLFYPELAYILDSRAMNWFFQYATDWQSLGAATDLGTTVWRIHFTDLDYTPRSWEVWITQSSPHRITRIITSRPSSMSISVWDTSVPFKGYVDPKHSTTSTYETTEHVECVFSKWNLDTPIPNETFARPNGTFKPKTFHDAILPFHVGDVIPLPELKAIDGTAVDLHNSGPIVLEFWSTEWYVPYVRSMSQVEAPSSTHSRRKASASTRSMALIPPTK